ncbi:MAG: TIGR04066 family peptide maturation system protein [Eubacteriaceae bacterium]|nr:TIGR04066 family peptide maturation system protein [Eubacteriaceae bacterium]
MNYKERIMIYPYDSNMTDVLRSNRFCDKYKEIYLCTMKGWGLVGNNPGIADGGTLINEMEVEDSFENCLKKVDTVVFVESDKELLKGKYVYPQMYTAASARKNIIDLLENNEIQEEIERYCIECEVNYSPFRRHDLNIEMNDHVKKEGLIECNVPIVVVAGETVNSKKFAVEYGIKEELENQGYNPILVGSKAYCEFLGDLSFPDFMLRHNINDIEQVLMFNRFINKIGKDADVIIIGIPGGIISCTDYLYGDFGILAYKVFQSINVDFFVFNVLYEEYYPSFFNEMQMFINKRFSTNVDVFNICNKHIDWEKVETAKPRQIPFLSLTTESIESEIKLMNRGNNTPIVSSGNISDMKEIVELLVKKLEVEEKKIIF